MDAVADAGAGVVFVVFEAVGGDGVELGGAGIVEVVERAAGGGEEGIGRRRSHGVLLLHRNPTRHF